MADYVTLAQVKTALGLAENDLIDDEAIELAIDAAEDSIEEYCGRRFTQVADARRFTVERGRVEIDDVATMVGFSVAVDADGDGVHERALDATDYRTLPLNAPANGRPITELENLVVAPRGAGAVQVTATFGWPAVPAQIRQAAMFKALRLLTRGPFRTAGAGEPGEAARTPSDDDITKLLKPFRKRPPVVVA
ncbi:MAG TPA: phage head-tail connector protein [Acidimicrobiales bacterium]|nr:phage head-tail connector protein [Acidimicrobiales bacterium]